jgi:hypothetical protein
MECTSPRTYSEAEQEEMAKAKAEGRTVGLRSTKGVTLWITEEKYRQLGSEEGTEACEQITSEVVDSIRKLEEEKGL